MSDLSREIAGLTQLIPRQTFVMENMALFNIANMKGLSGNPAD